MYHITFIFTIFIGMTFSWSFNGHKIIADIAQAFIDPKTLSNCISLWFPPQESTNFTMASISADPDKFRGLRPLHFMNLPGVPPTGTFVLNDITCPPNGCVVAAGPMFEKLFITSHPNVSSEAQPSALSFLVHFMGDIHQPLHVSYLADYGGNSVNVSFFNKTTNLHSLWDGGLIEKFISDLTGVPCGFPNPRCDHRKLSGLLILDMQEKMKKVLEWQKFSDYTQIAQESFSITNKNCYSFLNTERKRNQREAVVLGDDYFRQNIDIVFERLEMGGARLASVLTNACSMKNN